jgi:hypothetical protein
VRQHQVALQLGQPVAGDAGAGQLAEAGVDAIDHLVFPHDAVHGGLRRCQSLQRLRVHRQPQAAGAGTAQFGQGDLAGSEHEGGQGGHYSSCIDKMARKNGMVAPH